jgi:predicted dithiol-disulfide oxidoreductase (DUF899 family)
VSPGCQASPAPSPSLQRGWAARPRRRSSRALGTFGYLDVAPLATTRTPSTPGAWWHCHDEYKTREEEARQ